MNDVLSNLVATAGALLGSLVWSPADAIGAMLISVLIIFNWSRTGLTIAKSIAGRAAPASLHNLVTWVACHHSPDVMALDTVNVYSVGKDYFAEVDILLPGQMALTDAHRIGAQVQTAVENIDGIERAFVHLDVDTDHGDEHRDAYSYSDRTSEHSEQLHDMIESDV